MILSNDNQYRGSLGQSLKLDERSHVEQPLMEQLRGLGWQGGTNEVIELPMQQQPEQSYRRSFVEVILLPKLQQALRQINPFLTDGQIEELTRRILSLIHI